MCFCFFFFPLFSSLFHKDTYSPLTVPWGFTQKAHPQHGKRKARAPGRGSSHKMWCVALCVPFVIPLHNELPWPPTSPGLPAFIPPAPLCGSRQRWRCSSTRSREHSLCAQKRGNLGRMEIAMFLHSKKYLASSLAPGQSAGGPSG